MGYIFSFLAGLVPCLLIWWWLYRVGKKIIEKEEAAKQEAAELTEPCRRFVFLACRATGFFPKYDRVIECACIEMIDGKLTSREFHSYFRTRKKPQPRAFETHGITLESLQDKPKFSECAKQIIALLRGATLVAHNASFDVGFLDAELSRAKTGMTVSALVKEIVCTVKMGVEIFGAQKSLNALCKLYDIPFDVQEKHGALVDVKLLSQVYLRMHKNLNSQYIDL